MYPEGHNFCQPFYPEASQAHLYGGRDAKLNQQRAHVSTTKKRLPTPAPRCAACSCISPEEPRGAQDGQDCSHSTGESAGPPAAGPRRAGCCFFGRNSWSWHRMLFTSRTVAAPELHLESGWEPCTGQAFWSKSTQTRKLYSLFQTKYGKLIVCCKRDLLQTKQKQD